MIVNFGSINIDYVYSLDAFPRAGETLRAKEVEQFLGGKGINQSAAIALAGGDVIHCGAVASNEVWAMEQIKKYGIPTDGISRVSAATGHAIIYLDASAENQIVIYGGANQCLTQKMIDTQLARAKAGSWVLLQNETNMTKEICESAKNSGMKVAYSPAPFSKEIALPLIDLVDLLVVNETEAADLAKAADKDLTDLGVRMLLVTKGASGADLHLEDNMVHQEAITVQPVDTTGAGDTFLGSFLARLDLGRSVEEALYYSAVASSIQITRKGAVAAIPKEQYVLEKMKAQAT